ncbi:thermonuclease family protein [Deferrisoma palaeochoriense]
MPRDYPPPRTRPTRTLLAALLVLAAACLGADRPGRFPVEVVHVIDGDTVVARWAGQEAHVRLLGVDTPERAREGRPAEPFSAKATRFTRSLMERADRVELEIAGDRVDAHGRVLGFLWLTLPGRPDPVNLSEELLRAGLAEAIRHFEYPGKERFLRLEREACRRRVGLWRQRSCPY